MNRFKDKTAIVTGGASGIGRALSKELGRRGATVIISDMNEKGALCVAAEINAEGGRAMGQFLDVTRHDEFNTLIETTAKTYRGLDYIFNNAGIIIGGEMRDLDICHWHSVIDVNFYGVLYGTMSAYRIMVQQGYGHIINISSLGGLMPMPFNSPYSASKHAVAGMSLSLRSEAADLGVKVTLVCPGFIKTEIFEAMKMTGMDKEKLLKAMPLKRLPSPQEAARYIISKIEKNKSVIIFPFTARILWRITDFFPFTAKLLELMVTRKLRKFRK